MTNQEREALNEQTAFLGETPATVAGAGKLRRISAESLSVLQMVGSPFASVFSASMRGEQPEEIHPSINDICVFIWAHAEDADEVLDTALQCRPDCPTAAIRAAIRFCRQFELQDLGPLTQHIVGEALRLRAAASFDAKAPDIGAKKKHLPKSRQQSHS